MKKVFTFFMLMVLTLTLVACKKNNKPSDETDPTNPTGGIVVPSESGFKNLEYDGSKVTIEFWHRAGEANQQMFQKWIKEFNEIYPNITVLESKEADDYDGLADLVALTITTGKNPDIVESYPDHVARYGNAVLELNDFIDNVHMGYSEEEISDFLSGLWLEGQSYDTKGTIKSLPFTKSSEALYYNKAYFDKHGYTLPERGFWTWDEIFAIAQDIKTREPNAFPFGYDSSDNFFITASEQWKAPYTGYDANGKGQILFNNAQSKEMIKYFKDKVDNGLMVTRSLAGSYASDNMKKGESPYMFVGSTGGARYSVSGVKAEVFQNGEGYKVGVAPVPVKDTDHRRQIQQGPNINLFKKKNPQQMAASWLFAQFMLEPERTAEFGAQSGYAPVRHTAYETEEWLTYANKIVTSPTTIAQAEAKAIYDSIMMFRNNEAIFYTSAVFAKSSDARKQAGMITNEIFASDAKGDALDKLINNVYRDAYDYITG